MIVYDPLFPSADAIAHNSATSFGAGSGSIHLDDVACLGTEYRLIDCSYNSIDNCAHFEDAGVTCNTTCMLN